MTVHNENCLETMARMEDNSVDSIVTDPPYGLRFMAKKWDYEVPSVEIWREALRVLKPGGHLLAFAGTRTQHRMACNIEDAGFEIRDMLAWIYGSGFPKSLNISKAIDKAAGASQDSTYIPNMQNNTYGRGLGGGKTDTTTEPITPEAQQWVGFGTALKPALEPITLAQKPKSEKTIAANVLEHGTGGLNIDGCRVPSEPYTINTWDNGAQPFGDGAGKPFTGREQQGRWPANLIHDGSQQVLDLFPETGGGKLTKKKLNRSKGWCNSSPGDGVEAIDNYGDSGSAARFFYCAKASKRDRNEGLDDFADIDPHEITGRKEDSVGQDNPRAGVRSGARKNNHTTVKPTDLMRYLVRLVTPPGGLVYDPLAGSGSTGKAAVKEGFQFIGSELDEYYAKIANARIEHEMVGRK